MSSTRNSTFGGDHIGWIADRSVPITRALGYFSATDLFCKVSDNVNLERADKKRRRTIVSPVSKPSAQIYYLLWMIPNRRRKKVAVVYVVDIELVFDGLSILFYVIIGQAVASLKQALVTSTLGES